MRGPVGDEVLHEIPVWVAIRDNHNCPSYAYPLPVTVNMDFRECLDQFPFGDVWHITKPHRIAICPSPRSDNRNRNNENRGNVLWDFNQIKTGQTEIQVQCSWPFKMAKNRIMLPISHGEGVWFFNFPTSGEAIQPTRWMSQNPDHFDREIRRIRG